MHTRLERSTLPADLGPEACLPVAVMTTRRIERAVPAVGDDVLPSCSGGTARLSRLGPTGARALGRISPASPGRVDGTDGDHVFRGRGEVSLKLLVASEAEISAGISFPSGRTSWWVGSRRLTPLRATQPFCSVSLQGWTSTLQAVPP